MGVLSKKLRNLEGSLIAFWCPGCEESHAVRVDSSGTGWGWNQNVDLPTFTPSVLVRSGHYAPDRGQPDICWCTYNAEHTEDPAPFACHQCHSFVTDGKINFLTDSTHKLSGQTVDLPDWE